jgi:hypothetical protein
MHKKTYSKEEIIMTKKIKKENENVYVAKKPFYKKAWFWVLAILAIIVIGGAVGSGSDPDTSPTSENNSSSSSSNKVVTQNTAFRKTFDNIAVGDLMNHGDGGTTLDTVEKALGKPSATSATTVQGIETKNYIWSKDGVTITVEFNGDQAVSKHITGFKFSRASKFTLDAYNSLADGSAYEDVVSKYGEPDGLSEMIIGGNKNVTATWVTGTKGGTITLEFTNDSLVSKAQSGLK